MAQNILLLFAIALIACPLSAQTQENCNTVLTRISRKAAEKAIIDHRNDACSGLKKGPFGIDKTKALELREFSLCEAGPIVSASITVHAWCATSDKAVFSADVAGEVTATASANLDTCQVLNVDVSSTAFVVETGIQVADLKKKLREAAEKQIKDYCK
jgi:hypothetical protein